MIALVRHDFGQWSVVQFALRPWVGCHRRQVRLGEQQIPKQRRGVPFVGVSQTHGDDGLRFQVDRVLGFVRQVRTTILHLRDLGVRVMRVLPVVIGDLLRPTSSCTSTGSRCRMRDNVE